MSILDKQRVALSMIGSMWGLFYLACVVKPEVFVKEGENK